MIKPKEQCKKSLSDFYRGSYHYHLTPKSFHTSVKNIERWLKQLKDEEKIEFIGSPKTGGYYVKF